MIPIAAVWSTAFVEVTYVMLASTWVKKRIEEKGRVEREEQDAHEVKEWLEKNPEIAQKIEESSDPPPWKSWNGGDS